MFHLLYIRRELRRRLGRTLLTALGLAMGVGLVIGIMGVSQGLDDAQEQVLAPLDSVGTDILVTRVVGSTASSDAATTPTTVAAQPGAPGGGFAFGPPGGGRPPGGGGGGFFRGGGPNAGLNQEDTNELLSENKNVVTDLAALGKPGDAFTRDFFLSATLLSFPAEAVDEVAELDGVTSAVGGLVQLAQHQTGTVPEIVASIQTGGETVTQTVQPAPMTAAEEDAFRACLEASGFGGGFRGTGPGTTPTTTAGQVSGQQAPPPGGGPGACLPQRFREFRAQMTTPLRTIQQVVNPPQTDITNDSYTAAGIDPTEPTTGLLTAEQLTEGAWLESDATTDVLLNVAYAAKKSLAVGSTLPINGTDYTVVGLVAPTLTGSTADVYFPLATLQKLATKEGRVTQVSVKVDSVSDVPAVTKKIETLLPGAEVVTAASLADQVSGSLADAHDLAGRFGGILAVIVLLAAVAIAALLTLASIAKRVREIGTLRAIGWSRGRVVRQIVGETAGIGLLGGVLGMGIGGLVAAGVGLIAPSLSATTSGVPGLTNSTAAALFGQAQNVATQSTVDLHAAVRPSTLVLGMVFALAGGLIAGAIGSWRAARLSPAVALRDLG